jgi:hypothetical protein
MTREQVSIRKRAKDMIREVRSIKGMKKSEREAEAAKILAGAKKDIQQLEIRRTGHSIPEGAVCEICHKPIITGAYTVMGSKDGKSILRHNACKPGSKSWLESNLGQTASTRKYYERNDAHAQKSQ